MSKNLKDILQLGEPKKLNGASGVQAKAFKAAFQAAMKEVGKSLNFTAVHATEQQHGELATQRDKIFSAYQAVAKKIDPDNPDSSETAIKRVNNSVSKLRGGSEALQDYAAKHHAAWIENEEKFDAAAQRSTEMVDWGYENSERFVQVVDVIRERVNLRKYKEALEALKKLLEKLDPAYDDYAIQRDAKVDFEQMIEDNKETLDRFGASSHDLLTDWRTEIQGNLDSIEMSVEVLDYATALADLEVELPVIEEFLEEFDYEDALSNLQPRLDKLREEDSLSSVETAASMSIIWVAEKLMKQLATNGDYVQALEHLKKLEPMVDAETQNRDKVKFEAAKEEHRITLSNAYLTDHRDDGPLKEMKSDYVTLRTTIDDLADDGKWTEALAKFPETLEAAQKLLDEDTAYGKLKKLRDENPTDDQWLDNFGKNVPPDPMWNEETLLYRSYRTNMASGNYTTAIEEWKSLFDILSDLKIRVNASDAEATPKAAEVVRKVQKMAGSSDLTTLSQGANDKLVKKLEKLPQKKLRQMWKDLLKPSTPLGPQEKVVQAALFDAMKLDREFKKEEVKLREVYEAKLVNDPELQQVVKDWDAVDPRGNPLVDEETKKEMIQRAITTQSEAYGIDVPEIKWDSSYDWGESDFSADTNQITIGPKSLHGDMGRTHSDEEEKFIPGSNSIPLILHENAHNFQDELVKKYLRGELSKDDPMYEQVELFAYNYDDGYLELGTSREEHHLNDYSEQPSERHSYKVQESATDALLNEGK